MQKLKYADMHQWHKFKWNKLLKKKIVKFDLMGFPYNPELCWLDELMLKIGPEMYYLKANHKRSAVIKCI